MLENPEYLEFRCWEFRCCMCPNINEPESTWCPPSPIRVESKPCRFVKTYIDKRGWWYRVMGGIGGEEFKGRYQKPGKTSWRCMQNLPWRKSFDEAQSNLNILAKAKGWNEA